MHQAIKLKQPGSNMEFAHTLVHEMLHFKSYNAAQILESGYLQDYRVGLTAHTRDGSQIRFRELNEAVNEELTYMVCRELFENPIFRDERHETRKTMALFRDGTDLEGNPLFSADTYYAKIKPESKKEQKLRQKVPDRPWPITWVNYTFGVERYEMMRMFNRIADGDESRALTIFATFAKGAMTGNLLPAARLVEGTYGKGTFRLLGEQGLASLVYGSPQVKPN
jgi:hypothetical protein